MSRYNSLEEVKKDYPFLDLDKLMGWQKEYLLNNYIRSIDEDYNINCTNCKDCEYCINCINCNYCTNCTDCTNCTMCKDCINCNICNHSWFCINCNMCNGCGHCNHCNMCVDCYRCTYCNHCNDCNDYTGGKDLHGDFSNTKKWPTQPKIIYWHILLTVVTWKLGLQKSYV